MSAPKYKKAPDGEWLGFPDLRVEDIQHESFQETKHIAQSLVDNRKGRIHLLMEQDAYQHFLKAVRKKFGNISAFSVEKAVLDAVNMWIEGVEKE
jgi:hypothetical protein